MKPIFVKKFMFGTAQYHIFTENGELLKLKVDYKNNKYMILGDISDLRTKKEIVKIAEKLLRKKHNKNFAELINI